MSTKKITAEQEKLNVKFELAKQIRQMIDEAKKKFGSDWDEQWESEIAELVFDE